MSMPEGRDRDARAHVEVFVALVVPHRGPLPSYDHDGLALHSEHVVFGLYRLPISCHVSCLPLILRALSGRLPTHSGPP